MADLIGALRVAMRLDSAAFESGVKRARGQSTQLQKSLGTLAGAGKALGVALGGALAATTVGKYIKLADESKVLTAQLKLATAQFGSFAQAQKDVKRIAAETRTSLSATADLYSTLQRNAGELGISQDEAARATESITKAFRISGATAAEAAGGLRQFLQGVQSGTLRGEELNSVLENAPRLARALADGLGVTVGQLRAMGQAGELTGRQVLDALAGASDQIDKEFAQLPKTFDEAMTTVHNAAVITFGAFDRGGQFSTALANFITDGTGGFAKLEDGSAVLGAKIRANFDGLSDAFQPLLAGAQGVFGKIEMGAMDLANRILPLLRELDWIVDRKRELGDLFTVYGPGEKPNLPKSNIAGRFISAYNESLTNSRRRMGMTPVSRILGQMSEANNRVGWSPPAPRPAAGGGGGGRKAGGAGGGSRTGDAEREATRLQQAFANLVDRLDPVTAALGKYREELGLIAMAEKKGAISSEQASELRRKLAMEDYAAASQVAEQLQEDYGHLDDAWTMTADQIQNALHEMTGGLVDAADNAEQTTVRIAKTFKDMADDTISALDRVTGALKGGGFLNILSSLIGLGLQLGSIGVFGKSFQTRINSVPKMAGGGAFTVGGYGGVDMNVLSVNGIPQAMVSRGEHVAVSPSNDNRVGAVFNTYNFSGNLLTPEFWAQINAGHVAAADGGGQIGLARVRQANEWALR